MSTRFDRIFSGAKGVPAKLLRRLGVPFTLLQLASPNSASFGGNVDLTSTGIASSSTLGAYVWTGGDFTASGFVAGGWINVQGFPDANANGLAKVASVDEETLVVDKVLPDYPAGDRIGIAKLSAQSAYGVFGEWEQKHLAGGVIEATDLRITLDTSTLSTLPESEGWMIGQGSTPSPSRLYSVAEVLRTMSGENVAVVDVAARA